MNPQPQPISYSLSNGGQQVSIAQPPVPQELEYPFSLDRKDGKMLFLWFFIPVRISPADAYNFALIMQIFYGFLMVVFALALGQRKTDTYIELVFVVINFLINGGIMMCAGLVLQRNWLFWFKAGKLRAWGECWFWTSLLVTIPNVLWFIVGFAVNTHR
jgi:hypothetical protein